LEPQTVRRWIEGYEYQHKGERRKSAPVTYLARPTSGGEKILDFEQLLTLLLIKAFKQKGLGLTTIKKAAEKARRDYGATNPFVTKRFRSDGNRVFIDLDVKGRQRQLIDVLSDQRQFREIVEPSLFEDVVFIGDNAKEWWPLGKDRSVLVSPVQQFGAPHIARKGIRTDIIAQAVAAEGGDRNAQRAVAEWYGLTPREVEDAVEFEGAWLTKQAA
jgi:uncharacterized protein (DUF433 family)